MKHLARTTAVLLATAALAACGGGTDNSAANASSENAAMENMAMADTASPFSDAEQRMSEQMMAAVGSDVGQNWAKKMIVHHQGAIDMSEIVLQQNPKPEVAEMARMTIEKQGKEISDLQKLVKEGAADQKSAELFRPSMMDMHQKMMAAKGADVSETFLRKMLEHHRGGVTMSDVALQNGISGTLREKAQKTRDDQQKEAQMVEAMLRGETMQHAMQQSGVKSAAEAKAEPAPTTAEKPTTAPRAEAKRSPAPSRAAPKPAPAAKPEAAAKPAAPTCLPEHRAAGHC